MRPFSISRAISGAKFQNRLFFQKPKKSSRNFRTRGNDDVKRVAGSGHSFQGGPIIRCQGGGSLNIVLLAHGTVRLEGEAVSIWSSCRTEVGTSPQAHGGDAIVRRSPVILDIQQS
jgi:hypothetical protein